MKLVCSHIFFSCLVALSCTKKTKSTEPSLATSTKDEEKPPFVDLPHLEQPPASNSYIPSSGSADLPFTPGQGQIDLDSQVTCETYASRFWKVGAETREEAPGPLSTKITFTTKVLSREGSSVKVHASLKTPDASQNIEEDLSFDVCKEASKVATISTMQNCSTTEMGDESLTIAGKTYKTKKYRIGPCQDASGKTYDTLVWRANELPLWGVLQREVSGTIVPSVLNGKISAQTVSWSLGR